MTEQMASIAAKIKKIESSLPLAMAADRMAALREIRFLKRHAPEPMPSERFKRKLQRLEKRIAASVRRKGLRQQRLPAIYFNADLPITAKKDQIIQAISDNPVVIISGETGSGKTTQIPKFCLAAGRGIDGYIGHTQPRRIAAVTVARRIAEELQQNLGESVGYKIRFKDHAPKDAYLKIMTDGILLAETLNDRHLSAYDTVIVDEAHERSLNIDFILGILQILLARRNDLKIIITSATIDTEKFSKVFNNAPVIEVSGRMYPIEVRYRAPEEEGRQDVDFTHIELAAKAAAKLLRESSRGDMLIFMPTEQDIRDTCELIEAEKQKGVVVLPLFARLTATEQSRVFERMAARKIIVATNVAETSITIPGIRYVIDSGLARILSYSPRSRTTALPVLPISTSSADQRKGRCGRVENGVCIRLYSEADYQSRPVFTSPEIMRANLAEVILRMIALKLGDIAEFPFIDRPDLKNIKDGFNLLLELGAIGKGPGTQKGSRNSRQRPRHKSSAFVLTETGQVMSKIPFDPRLSRMLIESEKQGCIDEVAIITSALSIQDPRERPVEKAKDADRMHAIFSDPQSDFVTLLNIWNHYHHIWRRVKTNNQMKRYCREHYLSYKRMREWRDIYQQIRVLLAEQGLCKPEVVLAESGRRRARQSKLQEPRDAEIGIWRQQLSASAYEKLHKSILSGFLSNIAEKKAKNIFRAAKDREVMIFPGSGLFDKAAGWIVSAEIVETTRVFARTVANIDSSWLEELAGDLCRRTYLNPHWERNRGEVVACEQISLFGLIIVPDRKVSYGKINPEEAADIFIRSALVEGDLKKPLAFMKHNQDLIDRIKNLEDRIRRRDLLISQDGLFAFYKERLNNICDLRALTRYVKTRENERSLRMKKEDLLLYDPREAELELYPDRVQIGENAFDCSYRFEPGAYDDGVTLTVPAALAPMVPPESLEWMVPGLYAQKIAALVRSLPKHYRKRLVPVSETVDLIVQDMPRSGRPLVSALGEFIRHRFGVDIPDAAWPVHELPQYLKMRVSVTAPDGRELVAGRDGSILQHHTARAAPSGEFERVRRKWERTGINRWDFGDLPDYISSRGSQNVIGIAYPALEQPAAGDKSVNLRLFHQRHEAIAAHKQGVAALYRIHFSKDLKFLKRQMILPDSVAKAANYFGGTKVFEKKMLDRIVRNLFSKNIRSEKAFYAHAEAVAPRILPSGQKLMAKIIPVLKAYQNTRNTLDELQSADPENNLVATFFSDLRNGLARLVPESFLELYNFGQMACIERYIKALAIRAERARVDFEKDQAKAKEVSQFSIHLRELLNDLSPAASDEKRQAVENFFWMIEEYKVSVFAQELKTAFPVSKKRLQDQLKQIRRMV